MLSKRVNANDNVRAPFFKEVTCVAEATPIEEIPGLWPKTVNRPVNVFHPALLMPQNPVV